MRLWRPDHLAFCLLNALWAVWLGLHPAALPSDDALYLSRGLTQFSILEFSPHFPGYPGVMILGRLLLPLTGDPVSALFTLSVACTAALPMTCLWLAHRWETDGPEHRALNDALAPTEGAAKETNGFRPARGIPALAQRWETEGRSSLLVGLAALTQPLLPALGLGLLSDGPGLLFLLIGVGFMGQAPRWAGLWLGVALCCRPSNGILIAALALPHPRLWPGMAAVCLPALAAILTLEGWAYVDEGIRFVSGHTQQWGNTAMGGQRPQSGWGTSILGLSGGIAMAALSAPALAHFRHPLGRPLLIGTVWVLLMQNPDSLRHLAPLALLAILILHKHRLLQGGLILAQLWCLSQQVDWHLSPPPLTRMIDDLRQRPDGTVISNHGLAVLRQSLPNHRIVDAYYGGQANFTRQQAAGPIYTLTASRDGGRFPGESGLTLRYSAVR